MHVQLEYIAAQKSFSLLTMESIRHPAIKTYMEELVRTGKVVKEEAEQSDHERVEETMEMLAWTEKEVEEETEKSNEQRVEEKNNAIKQLFEPEINVRSISIATVREKYARIQSNATKMQRRCTTNYGLSGGHQQLSWHRKRNQLLTVSTECLMDLTVTKKMKTVITRPTLFCPQKLLQCQSQACSNFASFVLRYD